MSRSWERMVQKNSSQLNKQRKKQGKPSLSSSSGSATADIFKGRNYVLPITLVALAALYLWLGLASQQQAMNSSLSWIVVVLYVLLALVIFLRRPFLKVDKNSLSTIKFNRDRRLTSDQIEKIKVGAGSVVIEMKGTKDRKGRVRKGGNWVFTRLINRYDTDAMSERLERFAKLFNIPFEK
ncbi:hypothetical protein G8C92_17160 [Paenibacillus donghaensis]|uniref:hypothetical protein n=1 Tax=Paenibacillus donghaensis TaxID=414771 RepID=UPI0018842397|nr:hypothetical protein [Paenibacillus donghaensis]MBE9915747.1 hypothetical protein [Paenibacillus donghaensis]